MRARKLKNLEERFDWYAPVIEGEPAECRGSWATRRMPEARELRLDLGCGKGLFTLRAAHAEPDVLFVGMDNNRTCVAMAAKYAMEDGARNVVFSPGSADDLTQMFAPGEVDCLYLNFSSPFPRAKQAHMRLTYVDHLMRYRDVLAPGAPVRFRTDSMPLFEFSLTQFALAGYDVEWVTRDLHAECPGGVASEYEERLSAAGAKICALVARPGERPEHVEQTANLTLASYLPDDLDSLDHVPYGMEDTVRNLRNRRAHEEARAMRAVTDRRDDPRP